MVSISRVCDKQQGTFDNQDVSIYGKLWKRVKNRCRFEEKRKGNGIYKKNEKDVGRCWSGIDKGTRRNEEVSR